MSKPTPEHMLQSQGLQFVVSKGWEWQEVDASQIKVENCPFCHHGNFHFFMAISGTKDGLYFCHRCSATGNLRTLKEHTGDSVPGVESRSEWAGKGKGQVDELPNVDRAHAALLNDAEALDYLRNVRGFTQEIITRQKLGIKDKVFFKKSGETKALVIPYLSVEGNIVFAKYRTLPPAEKDFCCPKGWPAPLYNEHILTEGCKEVVFVEGEADAISLMSHGVENVLGVPGANIQKAAWIEVLDKVAPEKIYLLFDNDKVGQKAAQQLASRIGIDKCLKIVLPTGIKDINEYFIKGNTIEAFEELKNSAILFDVNGVTSSTDALSTLEDELEGKEDLAPKYVSQYPELNRLVGFEDGDVIDIVAPEKVGKFLSVDAQILTAQGWVRNGDLKVGDELASIDGKPNFVTGIFPQGKQELFRVEFCDGRSTLAGAPHLWKIHGCTAWERNDNTRIYTTDAIANEYLGVGNRRSNKVYIDLVSGDFGTNSVLPLDPWLLGVLIGDGGLSGSTPNITTADETIRQRAAMLVRALGDELKHSDRYSYRINGGNTKSVLKTLGLGGHKADTKFIPEVYLNSTKENRWELFRGLMDTDGTAGNKQGTLSYCTVSQQLAKDFVYLVRSLGGIAKLGTPQKKHYRYKGELRTGQPAWVIVARLPEPTSAFTLTRKLAKVKPRQNKPRLTFKSITSSGIHEAVCISVSHPSKLYITDDFIVTHNTTFGMNLIDGMVKRYNEPGLIVCLEMTQARLARKWVSLVTGFEDNLTVPGSPESKAKLEELKARVKDARLEQQSREADLYFAYPQLVSEPEDVFKLIRDCIRRYGVRWVMFDNLQRLCDDTLKNQAHRTVHLSQISKQFAKLAKDYQIKLIRILQPKRIEKGMTISTSDVDGSSQVAKDCDCMITMWRAVVGEMKKSEYEEESEGFSESDQSYDPKTKFSVGLSRYSSGGHTYLLCEGAKSRFTSYPEEIKHRMPKKDFNQILTTEAPVVAPVVPLAQENISI